ncbi:MAG TPA: LysR family transcriptional regulator [Candidatus Sulfotelmatobacter sp.]|nr:LysR family transcriptional regulator [Candidatus Sulfotelmatobacter sp.]
MQKRISLAALSLGDWDDLRYFLAVARSGSFTKAAELLKSTQTTVGRRLHALETRSGTKLFDRRYDGMYLTPAGREVFNLVEAMEQCSIHVERLIVGPDQGLTGTVRIATTEGIGSYWLTPRLDAFQRKFPKLVVEVLTGNEVLDLAKREADLSIRLARPTSPKLVAVNVGRMRFGLFCAGAYIDRFGRPSSLAEVAQHHSIADHSSYVALPFWQDFIATHPKVMFRSNSSIAFLQSVRDGRGIGLFPLFSRFTAPDLIRLDIELDLDLPIWLVSHSETNKSARTRALWSYVRDLFRRDRAAWFS